MAKFVGSLTTSATKQSIVVGSLTTPATKHRSGVSLVECVVSTALIGILMTTSLQTVGVSLRRQTSSRQSTIAAALANGLASEIFSRSYMEPGLTSSAIGREVGEIAGSRVNYDDVDDYDGWVASPPQSRNGTVRSEYTGWQSSVTVQWVTLSNLQQVSGTETGVKRITVTIRLNGTVMATRVAIRTNPI